MVDRIEQRLRACAGNGGGALLPYLTAGFPDADATVELIQRAAALGAAAIEIGFPYSDSIADGPVIQSSFHEALSGGHTLADTFRLVSQARPSVECALIAMVSYSIVHRQGEGSFMDQAAAAGFDGIILPDVPIEEADLTNALATVAGLSYIGFVAPATSLQRIERTARESTGFIYQIAVSGTTGERSSISTDLATQVAAVRKSTQLPICVGFGISSAEHVKSVCEVADGAIVGSAIVRKISDSLAKGGSRADAISAAGDFIAELMTGCSDRV